jgi:hypothetical protein
VVPWHPYTLASQTPLTSSPTEVKVEVFPTSEALQPGHRLRIALTTADLPHQGPNASILANSAGGVTTVYFDPAHRSRVYLGADSPLLSSRKLGAAAVPTGAGAAHPASTVTAPPAAHQQPATVSRSVANTPTASMRNTSITASELAGPAAVVVAGGALAGAAIRRRRRERVAPGG